jgi:NAD(P)H-dependent FMN reductase
MRYLVISSSLSPNSRSRLMARHTLDALKRAQVHVDWLDLALSPLPLCDASHCYGDENAIRAASLVEQADGLLLASPIYNFDVSAATKNLLELTGKHWAQKVVGLLCCAGGRNSYMSVMGVANSLMLNSRAFILPRFVYATGEDFSQDAVSNPEVSLRLDGLVKELIRVTTALRQPQSGVQG